MDEEKILIESHCLVDEKVLRDGLSAVIGGFRWFLAGIFVLVLVYDLKQVVPVIVHYGWAEAGNLIAFTVAVILLVAFFIYRLLIYRPKKAARQSVARLKELGCPVPYELTARFMDSHIGIESEGTPELLSLEYDSIKHISVCAGKIFLRTEANQFLSIDPDRFAYGTEADFWRLLREKTPDALPRSKRA